jgi:hypothetical protein
MDRPLRAVGAVSSADHVRREEYIEIGSRELIFLALPAVTTGVPGTPLGFGWENKLGFPMEPPAKVRRCRRAGQIMEISDQ